MTLEEFSNGFDTLLSSYLHNSLFGELSSLADVTLDEYEKSIFLTLAQDQIVKTYFERLLNSNGAGFDDSTRRLMDYANLITTRTFNSTKTGNEAFSEHGILIDFDSSYTNSNVFGTTTDSKTSLKYYLSPLFIINERVVAGSNTYTKLTSAEISALKEGDVVYTKSGDTYTKVPITTANLATNKALSDLYKSAGIRSYVVVPLNYKEYDRMMSRAYCEPLKRQAWRLFETDASDLNISSEIILRSDAGTFQKYVCRYVRRPRPIVLVDLSNTDNGLTIDGVNKATDCELNPVIHNEILELAVRMALTARGIETRDAKAAREAQQRGNN